MLSIAHLPSMLGFIRLKSNWKHLDAKPNRKNFKFDRISGFRFRHEVFGEKKGYGCPFNELTGRCGH